MYRNRRLSNPRKITRNSLQPPGPTLEDLLSLQVAITRFCAQLATGAVDEKRARLMLATLRLAQKNLEGKRSLYDASL